jgi:hypothetical protein
MIQSIISNSLFNSLASRQQLGKKEKKKESLRKKTPSNKGTKSQRIDRLSMISQSAK